MRPHTLNRRSFVRFVSTMGLVAPALLPPLIRAASPNGKLRHGSIGVNGMGWADLHSISSHPQVSIAAICDVDLERRKRAEAHVPDARRYQDWRELLEAEHDRVDSISVSVPDHMHAIITLRALRMKKHVWCQKPLCHDVTECRAVASAAKAAGVVTQLGTQGASGMGDRMAVHYMKQQVLGKVRRVILCSNRPGAIKTYRLKGPRPNSGGTPPKHLNWDSWIGTAPMRPYAPKIYHPTLWRAWQDFGTGWSGDIGCHVFDAPWKGLGLTAPISVKAEVQGSWAADPKRRADNWPQSDHITWVFPGNEQTQHDELVVEWFDGLFYPPPEIQSLYRGGDVYPGEAAMILGTEGALLLPHGSGPQLLPREKFLSQPRPKLPPRNHWHHFVDACLGGEATESHFQQTGPMTEAILLGTVAIRTPGVTLKWDSRQKRITNNQRADGLLRRTYRDGWDVGEVALSG